MSTTAPPLGRWCLKGRQPKSGHVWWETEEGQPRGAGTCPAYLSSHAGLKAFTLWQLFDCHFLRSETSWATRTLSITTKPTNHLNELTINSGGKIGSCVGSSGWNSEGLNRVDDIIAYDRESVNGWTVEEKAIHMQPQLTSLSSKFLLLFHAAKNGKHHPIQHLRFFSHILLITMHVWSETWTLNTLTGFASQRVTSLSHWHVTLHQK